MKKKICFILSKFSKGGGERVVSILSNELVKYYDVEILLLGNKSEEDYSTQADVIEINGKTSCNNSLYLLLKSILNLKKHIAKADPIAIISFMELPNLVNMLVSGNHKRIISIRNHMSTKWENKLNIWNLSIKYLYKYADTIISPTQLIKDDLVNHYYIKDEKIKIINNPYPIKNMQENLIRTDKKKFVIATMGSLVKAKGVYSLLNAYIIFHKQHPELESELIFIGKGPEKHHLQSIVAREKCDDFVKFKGFLKNPHQELSKSSLYVLSSFYEGFPNALVEAMICQVPVIATNCPSGPSEILSDEKLKKIDTIKRCKYGYIMPVFDENTEKKEGLLANFFYDFYLLNNKEKNYLTKKALQRALQYDVSNIVKEWKKYIDE